MQLVGTVVTKEGVVVVLPQEKVVASSAKQNVGTDTTLQFIVPFAAIQEIGPTDRTGHKLIVEAIPE